MSRTIYLDNNATTQVDPEVFDAMVPWLKDEYGNPSSSYALGRRASEAIEESRRQLAGLVGTSSEEILFTSCGTESINTAILSCLAIDPDRRHIVTSAVEHSATIKLCEHLDKRGYEITWLPVDSQGLLDPQAVESAIREDTAVVSLLWANNETGVLFPVEEIASITASKKVSLHVDAVQAVGKIPMNLATLGAQFVSLSGHKLHAAKGIGALAVSRRSRFTPLLRGSQEDARRGGTQNVASIVGFGKAAEIAARDNNHTFVKSLRDQFEDHMLQHVPGVEINGHRNQRLPNTSNLTFEGLESEGALILLGEKGICCSAGSACTSGSVHPSHVLRAMGLSNDRARASLRFSFGRLNTREDLEEACGIIPPVVEKLRGLKTHGSPVAVAA
jgi:cysteine desulfurase